MPSNETFGAVRGALPARHDPRPGATLGFSAERGDSVRLYGFSGDNWLELRVRARRPDGLAEAALVQCVDGVVSPLGNALARLDDGGASFLQRDGFAAPIDAFGRPCARYDAASWGGERASDGWRAYACDELPAEDVSVGDAVRLSGYAPDNWLDVEVLAAAGQGWRVRASQTVGGKTCDLGEFEARFDRSGLVAFPPHAADAFGRPMDSYRAPFYSRLPAAFRGAVPEPAQAQRPACLLATDAIVAKVEAALASSRPDERRGSVLESAVASLLERSLATDDSIRSLSVDVRSLAEAVRSLVSRSAPAKEQEPSVAAAVPAEPAAPAEVPPAVPVLPAAAAEAVPAPEPESAAASISAQEVTMERTSITTPASAAETVREAAPDRSPDVVREISKLAPRAGGKISWGAKEVVLFRLGESAFSVRPTKVGAETYTPKEGGPWNAENTGARLWKMWLADGGDAFNEAAWKAALALMSAGVEAANAKARNHVGKDEAFAHELDAAIGREGKAVRGGRTVKAGGSGNYMVHVESSEREVRADFFEKLVAAVAKNRSATRSGIRIRGAAGSWEFLPKGGKAWKEATDAAVWAMFSEELLWEKWERLEFARHVLRARKGHKGVKVGEVAIEVPETPVDARAVEVVPAQAGSTVVHEKVVVRKVDAAASAEGQGANKTVQGALEAARAAALPLLPPETAPTGLLAQ